MPLGKADGHSGHPVSAWRGLKAITHPQPLITSQYQRTGERRDLLFLHLVSPCLLEVTGVDVQWLSLGMLGLGLCSIARNLLGSYLTDVTDVTEPVGSILIDQCILRRCA